MPKWHEYQHLLSQWTFQKVVPPYHIHCKLCTAYLNDLLPVNCAQHTHGYWIWNNSLSGLFCQRKYACGQLVLLYTGADQVFLQSLVHICADSSALFHLPVNRHSVVCQKFVALFAGQPGVTCVPIPLNCQENFQMGIQRSYQAHQTFVRFLWCESVHEHCTHTSCRNTWHNCSQTAPTSLWHGQYKWLGTPYSRDIEWWLAAF